MDSFTLIVALVVIGGILIVTANKRKSERLAEWLRVAAAKWNGTVKVPALGRPSFRLNRDGREVVLKFMTGGGPDEMSRRHLRIRAPVSEAEEEELHIVRKPVKIARPGMVEITTGDRSFDERFAVRASKGGDFLRVLDSGIRSRLVALDRRVAVAVRKGRFEFASSPLPPSEQDLLDQIEIALELYDRVREP